MHTYHESIFSRGPPDERPTLPSQIMPFITSFSPFLLSTRNCSSEKHFLAQARPPVGMLRPLRVQPNHFYPCNCFMHVSSC